MMTSTELELQSFVLLRLGERMFALSAREIVELVAPSRVFRFPHRTKELEGVILRRGRIVPVCDISERLIGKRLASRRFYLVATRKYSSGSDWIGLPVTGECELITAEMTPPGATDSPHVAGWIAHDGDVIEVLNLEELTPGPRAQGTQEPSVSSAAFAHEVRP
jgi:chemotaxis signal transduction protein